MAHYQVIARKYRPQKFKEVIGQEPIVTTLKNAIKNKRLAHAYLFCGSRGTGKTTLARIFAKALNCLNPNADGEPCSQCSSCKEIASGHSLDVLEIDGASHRGIDDVRQINETVGYATSTGGYKIYLIDEVHMLTKEAFNALLKTLEEPPPRVLFFFATTEPHKVLPTILSRCQRFNLSRIPSAKIVEKLGDICSDLKVEYEQDALLLIAQQAEGGLRDAESLLDQMLSFHEGKLTAEVVNNILGTMPRTALFALDRAGKEGRLAYAFELAHAIFTQGKDWNHFVELLMDHFRTLLLLKVGGKDAPYLQLAEGEREAYEASAKLYTQEQCVTLLEYLADAQPKMRFTSASQVTLENILLHILRSHQRLPIDYLVRRLTELEKALNGNGPMPASPPPPQAPPKSATPSMSIDPTPTAADLGIKPKNKPATPPPTPAAPPSPTPSPQQQHKYDTLLQFAAVELEGTLQKQHR